MNALIPIKGICTKNVSTHCLNIVLLLYYVVVLVHLNSNHYIFNCFFKSRQNTTFGSKVGKTGVGKWAVQDKLAQK